MNTRAILYKLVYTNLYSISLPVVGWSILPNIYEWSVTRSVSRFLEYTECAFLNSDHGYSIHYLSCVVSKFHCKLFVMYSKVMTMS